MRQMTSRHQVTLPLDRFPLVRSRSLEEVRGLYSSTATPTRLEVKARESFECRLNHVAIGPMTISTLWLLCANRIDAAALNG